MSLVIIGAGIFALSAIALGTIVACALRRALNETDEWCDQVDQDVDAGIPYCPRVAGPDELCEVDAVIFDWPVMAPSARVIELFPRRGDAA